tara:strand:- start:52 stop:204 length:153 start_codon:yes stop_codon:yes gene_type:complete
MAKKKKVTAPKTRNWLALHAKGMTGRKGAGAHKNKKKYTRKTKHQERYNG